MITPTDSEIAEIKNSVDQGNLIEGIQLYRKFTGADLKAAKDAVEAMRSANGVSRPGARQTIRFGEFVGLIIVAIIIFFAGKWVWHDIKKTLNDPYDSAGTKVRAESEAARQLRDQTFKDGYVAGVERGLRWADEGNDVPTAIYLDKLAAGAYDTAQIKLPRADWIDAYKIGFEAGFKKKTQKAF